MTRAAAQARPDRQGAPAPAQVAARPADERYSDYYNRGQNVEREPYQPPVQNQVAQNQPPQNPAQQQPPAADRYAERNVAPSRSPQQVQYPQQKPANASSSAQPSQGDESGYQAAESQRRAEAQHQLAMQNAVQTAGTEPSAGAEQPIELRIPPGSPPLALEGYCPVTLVESRSLPSGDPWQVGDPNVGAIHRGMLYLFTNTANQQKFMANPDHYSPVLRGHDPVLALDKNQAVPGRREFGVFCEGRIYLFSSEATLEHFARNSKRYSADILQAMR
jgi:YHS domain-containing protein